MHTRSWPLMELEASTLKWRERFQKDLTVLRLIGATSTSVLETFTICEMSEAMKEQKESE